MPWTGPVLPSLIGLAFPVKRAPTWSTVMAEALSGKRTRYPLFSYPIYGYEISFSVLRSAAAVAELQSLLGFINQVNGPAQLWGFSDPDDSTVANQAFGTGDGTTTNFQLCRTFGGFTEPVFLLNGNPTVYVAGVARTLGVDFNVSQTGNIAFGTAPANGAALTWSGSYYWPCRFDDDAAQFAKAMSGYFNLKSLKFTTEKLDIVTTSPPSWIDAYDIGGTRPTSFADFVTEGGANHYWYAGSSYASAAAWLAARSGTYTNSSGKYVTNVSGLLASVAANTLPFDYSPTSVGTLNGLLLEGASTNVAEGSNAISSSPWGLFNATGSSSGTAPDGVSTATLLTPNSGIGIQCWAQNEFTPGFSGSMTYNVYLKHAGAQYAALTGYPGFPFACFDLVNGIVGHVDAGATAIIAPAGNGFYKCSITIPAASDAAVIEIHCRSSNGSGNQTFTGSETVLVAFAQTENLPFATSYIPTTSSTASRSADALSAPYSPSSQFTKLLKLNVPAGFGSTQYAWSLNDGTSSNAISVSFTSGGHLQVVVVVSGSTVATLDFGAVTAGSTHELAFSVTANSLRGSLDGGAIVSAASFSMPSGLTTSNIGARAGGNHYYGDFMREGLWDAIFATDAQLQALAVAA